MTNIKNISKAFPQQHLTPIIRIPTYETISILHIKLNANSCSIRTSLGGGLNGHLGITIYPNEYLKETGDNFVCPLDPLLTPK